MATTLTSTGITFPDATTQTTAAGASVGVGQSWSNLTASRALGTTYTNSTGKPIQVAVCVKAQSGNRARVYINGVMIMDSTTQDCCGVPQYSWFPMSFIVPDGNTYQVTGNIGFTTWAELR